MKKYLFTCLLSFCIIINVKAMTIPQFDVTVSNPAGASVTRDSGEVTTVIPQGTELKLAANSYSKDFSVVFYDGLDVNINNSDIKILNDIFEPTDGYELEEPKTHIVNLENGTRMYKGPSDIFYEELDVVIPKDTNIEYKYIDTAANTESVDKFVYATYNGMSGWVYITDDSENPLITVQKEIVEEPPVEPEKTESESSKPVFKKVELVIVIGLAVILLLSLTSLIALVVINKKGGKLLEKIIIETEEEPEEEKEE